MAEVAYCFPSSTGSYKTAAGLVRIKFWYTAAAASTDVAANISKMAPLSIPLEVSPGSFRYSNTKIKFQYHAGIEIMLADIETNSKQNMTFVDILIGGSLYWRGLLDWESITKTDYYILGGSLSYRYIEMKIDDAMTYFWKNGKTLNDASYSEGIIIQTLIYNIFNLIGFSSGDVSIDSNIYISEESGNTYNLGSLKIGGLSSSFEITTFLKAFMVSLGLLIINLKGKMYIIRRIGGTLNSISNIDIIDVKKINDVNLIKYVKIFSTLDVSFIDYAPWSTITDIKVYGNESEKSSINFIYDATGFLNLIYTTISAGNYPSSDPTNSSGDTNWIQDLSAGIDYYAAGIETGDCIKYYDYIGPNTVGSIVENGLLITKVFFRDTAITYPDNALYSIQFGNAPVGTAKRFKNHKLIAFVGSIYNEYFLTFSDIFKIKLKNISTYDDLSKRFVFNSLNHRARNASIDIVNDKIIMELVEVT